MENNSNTYRPVSFSGRSGCSQGDNPRLTCTTSLAEGLPYVGLTEHDVQDAHARLTRFAPYLAKAFPETAATGGIIESELAAIPAMQKRLEKEYGQRINGEILLKKDSHLPISGSIKARGGIYEVLTHAEKLALEAGLLTTQDDYSVLLSPEFKQFFSQYSIAVGSPVTSHVDWHYERPYRL